MTPRATAFALGLALLAGSWWGPLPALAAHTFFGHMLLHMIVVAVAAPLLALGLAGTAFDPVVRWPHCFPPLPLSALELVVVWAWHTPGLHHAARHTPHWFAAEQACFLLSGWLVWISAFGGDSARRAERSGTGIAALLLTSMHMTFLGALLALAPRPVYGHSHHLVGMSPLEDQHLGGAVMLIIGGISYLSGGLWLAAGLVRRPAHPEFPA